jgi:hypothetical protein
VIRNQMSDCYYFVFKYAAGKILVFDLIFFNKENVCELVIIIFLNVIYSNFGSSLPCLILRILTVLELYSALLKAYAGM